MSQVKPLEVKVTSTTNTTLRSTKREAKPKPVKVVKPKVKDTKAKVAKKPSATTSNKKSYRDMIKNALTHLPESRSGTSCQAILKYVIANNDLGDYITKSFKNYFNSALVSATKKGDILHVKGAGANGSFKLAKKKKSAPILPKAPKSNNSSTMPKKTSTKTATSKKSPASKAAKKSLTKGKVGQKSFQQAKKVVVVKPSAQTGTKSRPTK